MQQQLDYDRLQRLLQDAEAFKQLVKDPNEVAKKQAEYEKARDDYNSKYGGSTSSTSTRGLTATEVGKEVATVAVGTAMGGPFGVVASKVVPKVGSKVTEPIAKIFGEGVGVGVGEGVTQLAFDSLDSTKSNFEQNIDSAVERGGESAVIDVAVNSVLKPLGSTVRRYFPGTENKKVADTRRMLEEIGGKTSARLETDNVVFDIADSFFSSGFFANELSDVRRINYNALRDNITLSSNRLSNSMSQTLEPDALGNEVLKLLQGQSEMYRGVASSMYRELDAMVAPTYKKVDVDVETGLLDANGNPVFRTVSKKVVDDANFVDLAKLKEFAKKEKELLSSIKNVGGDSVYSKIMSMDDKVSFQSADELSQAFGEKAFKKTADAEPKAAGRYKKLGGLLNEAMDKSAQSYGQDFYTKFKVTRKFVEQNKKIFENDFILGLTASNPDAVAAQALSSPASAQAWLDNMERYKKISEMTGDTARFSSQQVDAISNAVKSSWLEKNLFYKGLDTANERISIKEVQSAIQNKSDKNYYTLRKLYSPKQINDIESVTNTIQRIQNRETGVGEFALKVVQGGIILGVVGVGSTVGGFGGGAAALLTPKMMSVAMTNQNSIKIFKALGTAIRSNNTAKAASLTSRLVASINREEERVNEVQQQLAQP